MSQTPEIGSGREGGGCETPPALLVQAEAAAEQALQLARLAQESALLARQLNARWLQQVKPATSGVAPRSLAHDVQMIAEKAGAAGTTPASTCEVTVSAASLVDGPVLSEPAKAPSRGSGRARQSQSHREAAIVVRGRAAHRASAPSARRRGRVQDRRGRVRVGAGGGDSLRTVTVRVRRGELNRPTGVSPFFQRNWNSLLGSAVLLGSVLLVLAVIVLPARSQTVIHTVIAGFSAEPLPMEDVPVEVAEEAGEQLQQEVVPDVSEALESVEVPEPKPVTAPLAGPEPQLTVDADPQAAGTAVKSAGESRSAEGRRALLQRYGGTAASESAVQAALDFFVRHQRRDGSWDFADIGQCSGAGDVSNPVGATSYVLLTFLGSGQTHHSGRYQEQVRAGLDFIIRSGRRLPGMIDFSGCDPTDAQTHHRFYVHGAATQVLSEALAMTGDRRLRAAVVPAVNVIIASQDPRGGGWRYVPGESGSTSVTGLQLAALVAASKAGVAVPERTLAGVSHFLDSVRSDATGARYGYTAAAPRFTSSSTAIALLSRMSLGAEREDAGLRRGVTLLDEGGPRRNLKNLYFVYYATQVLRNWGGPEWDRWNPIVRDELVRTQVRDGAAAGSWLPGNRSKESLAGGRLFATCLSALTLEVYYRYPPWRDGAVMIGQGAAEHAGSTVKQGED